MAFGFTAPLTVDHTQVGGSTLTAYPVLFRGTFDGSGGIPDLRSTGNGGKLRSDGFDLYFYSDSGLTTRIPAERVYYNAATGAGVWFFKRTLSSSADTLTYLGIGDSSISSDPNSDATYGKTSVWDTNYKGVLHLADGTTLSLTDSTSNANNGTGSGTPTATAGLMDGAAAFVAGSSQYVTTANTFNSSLATLSCWIKVASLPGSPGSIMGISQGNGGGTTDKDLVLLANGKVYFYWYDGGTKSVTSTGTLSTGVWHHVAAVIDGAVGKIYIDGAIDGSTGSPGSFSGYGGAGWQLNGSLQSLTAGNYMTCSMDEARLSNVDRSSFMTADYNSQKSGATFLTVGSQSAVGGGVVTLRPLIVLRAVHRAASW